MEANPQKFKMDVDFYATEMEKAQKLMKDSEEIMSGPDIIIHEGREYIVYKKRHAMAYFQAKERIKFLHEGVETIPIEDE